MTIPEAAIKVIQRRWKDERKRAVNQLLYVSNIASPFLLEGNLAGDMLRSIGTGETLPTPSPMEVGGLLAVGAITWALRRQKKESTEIYEEGGERLHTEGSFSLVRHPMYALQRAFSAAYAITFANPLTTMTTIGHWATSEPLARAEEATMRREFGKEYDRYAERTPRWMPRIGDVKDKVNVYLMQKFYS